MTGGDVAASAPPPEGKRAAKAKARNAAIENAAMALATAGEWPSPAAVAERAGISGSVVERETALLVQARRHWVELTGHAHPQWRDPGQAAETKRDGDGTDPAEGAKGGTGAGNANDAECDVDANGASDIREREIARKQRTRIRQLNSRNRDLEELVRRINLGVRPAEIDAILKAGTKKGTAGEADKGVRVDAK